ncbi:RpiB/LacA/LacB family sugar-phosphate isomerase [Streptomyces gamaensis]|uniref:RpiB/LacA/LacB family sugar-phosphate isomerase n=1 Tax=Streptomyces gamaensis TaxID=1763542 RepID=A0ABW0YWD4_9ACTN
MDGHTCHEHPQSHRGERVLQQLRIAVGSDKAGRDHATALTDDLRASSLVSSIIDISALDGQGRAAYPEIAFAAAQLVADGRADRALLVCHTGLGMAIAANKIPGIRAVTAHDSWSVRCAVLSNNAQVLTLGQGIVGLGLARRLVEEWLTYRFDDTCSAAAKIETISAFEDRWQGRSAADAH